MSPIMWTLVTGTKRFAPQNLPTSIWYWSARLAAFHELRDGVTEHTDRVLLDLYARW